MNMGGRTYPVRYYPIAIRLRTLAFGNMVAMIVDPVNIRATCASALPTHSRSSWGPHNIYSAILCIALNPQSGDSSGAILGVRSVALLHVIDSGKIRKDWVKIVHIELRILNFEGKSCVYLKKIVPL